MTGVQTCARSVLATLGFLFRTSVHDRERAKTHRLPAPPPPPHTPPPPLPPPPPPHPIPALPQLLSGPLSLTPRRATSLSSCSVLGLVGSVHLSLGGVHVALERCTCGRLTCRIERGAENRTSQISRARGKNRCNRAACTAPRNSIVTRNIHHETCLVCQSVSPERRLALRTCG